MSMKFPFRNLYLKIFIWFWLAMIIINVVLFAAFVAYGVSGYVVSGWLMLRGRRTRAADAG